MVVILLASSQTTVARSSAPEAPANAPPSELVPQPRFSEIESNFDVDRYLARTSVPESSAYEPSGNFRFTCSFSHLAHDDPIVKYGKKGRSQHLHMFFGNRNANANSDWESLRSGGSGSCQGGPVNRSAYWAPAMYTANGKKVVIPHTITVYYKSNGMPADQIERTSPLPMGLRAIAGHDMDAPGTDGHFEWYCENSNQKSQTIPHCANGQTVIVSLDFPNCWNGDSADAPNHRSHMAYMVRNSHTGQLRCPNSHPYMVPQFTLGVWFRSDGHSSEWKLGSDRMGGTLHPNGSTWHADWFGAWDRNVLRTWTSECIREMRNCIWGELGNNKRLTGGYTYDGPLLRSAPKRGRVVR